MMLKPRNWICWLFIICIIISIVRADDDSSSEDDSGEGDTSTEGCDADDASCLEEQAIDESSTTSNSTTIMASSSYALEVSSTYMAAATDILTDFHEAKLVKPRLNPNTPVNTPLKPSNDENFQDTINLDQDIGSSGEGMPAGTVTDQDTKPLSALSNLEASVLSACGVLVVAGVAVGIFVWKNTTRRRNIPRNHELPSAMDIEENTDDDFGGSMMKESIKEKPSFESMKYLQRSINVNLPLPAFDRDDFFSNWQRRNSHTNNSEYVPKQKSPIRLSTAVISEKQQAAAPEEATTFRLPSFEHTLFTSVSEPVFKQQEEKKEDEKHNIFSLSASHLRHSVYGPMFGGASPQLQGNTQTIRSALDPAFDPTALTYPLQKFFKETTPNLYSSPMQISLNLGDDDDEEEGQQQVIDEKKRPISPQQQQQQHRKRQANSGGSVQHLTHQLSKLLRPSASASALQQNTTLEINLREDPVRRKSLDRSTEAALDHLGRVYQAPGESFVKEYKSRYLAEHGKPFMSPLGLPTNEYVPLRDSKVVGLVSRADVLADPKRRLGQDEIALWEINRKKKELKRLSLEMWDEQVLREEIEEYDRKHIACYYGNPAEEEEEEAVV